MPRLSGVEAAPSALLVVGSLLNSWPRFHLQGSFDG
ncbi:hypothetical protein ACP70R_002030 [Stipagrostis hirtigluma subsp. patula]